MSSSDARYVQQWTGVAPEKFHRPMTHLTSSHHHSSRNPPLFALRLKLELPDDVRDPVGILRRAVRVMSPFDIFEFSATRHTERNHKLAGGRIQREDIRRVGFRQNTTLNLFRVHLAHSVRRKKKLLSVTKHEAP